MVHFQQTTKGSNEAGRITNIGESMRSKGDCTTLIVKQGTKDLLEEQPFIKEKVATIIVEIAKRDWPQQWADLLNTLVQISLIGVSKMHYNRNT